MAAARRALTALREPAFGRAHRWTPLFLGLAVILLLSRFVVVPALSRNGAIPCKASQIRAVVKRPDELVAWTAKPSPTAPRAAAYSTASRSLWSTFTGVSASRGSVGSVNRRTNPNVMPKTRPITAPKPAP